MQGHRSKYSIYHFFQKKTVFQDPNSEVIRVFKMPRFVVPTLFLSAGGLVYYLFLSKQERIINVSDE